MKRRACRTGVCYSALVVVLSIITGCGSGSTTGPSSSAGTLTIRLTDSPFSDAQAVLVTFSEVSVHVSGGDFITLPFAPVASSRTCDLKKLQGVSDVLGTGPLPPGHYTQIRLVVASAMIYFTSVSGPSPCASGFTPPPGGTAMDIPSGDVRLNREFDVPPVTAITLDFDGDQSIKQTGSGRFVMTPVITVVGVQ